MSVLILGAITVSCTQQDVLSSYAGAVGPDLYSVQTIKNNKLLAAYTSSLCRQADLPLDQYGRCAIATSAQWKSFVDMGLYDIDQRCDSFLDNLYYKDKAGPSVIAQISNTRSLTTAVLDAAAASSASMRIVAAAFDFAESSFRNVNNTLIQALDPTTVKAIVFRRQQDVKQQIYAVSITNKPQALHALRTYLRVCMPFTIEMEANAALTTVQRTDDPGDSPIAFNDGRKTADDVPGPGPFRKPPIDESGVVDMFGAGSGRNLEAVKTVQKKLCVAPTGKVAAQTRTAIEIFRQEKGDDPKPFEWHTVTADEAKYILGPDVPACQRKFFLNYYEMTSLSNQKAFDNFVTAFNSKANAAEQMTQADERSADPASSFRKKIVALKTRLPQFAEPLEDKNLGHITSKFYTKLQLN